ncbi:MULTISPECIES: cobalamin biosynthesis protein [Nitrosopumilus]|uniref:Cobalamin (Vitamin B12) biosynthesis CbiG protein n=1 Tax=Nitrosopumilus piranensis TaxID=1582439 RepID=A0A0C5BWL5_9ARCH|nr:MULTISPECIES: cobalamin biosynthesis protein [Nitrosopumilus]AJM91360.1 Cobalamin (Vitamin B12) biosynthesis CbiG protein [Nitrosopumilus piranensis]KAF6245846.1 precorrin-3B C(17)-methyltransferase [Nitrosopumilus sp. b2]
MEKISVLAITKNGINIGQNLKEFFPKWSVFAPSKLSNQNDSITWYSGPTSEKIVELFKNNDALICLFSLGAVIRLIAPHLKDKKTDPAVIVIDDKTNFVISVLSGHIGGANELTEIIAKKLQAQPVVTTAADVNKTIAVDLVGRDFGWKIEDDSNVTRISAHMVNEEQIGVFQDVGKRNWYKQLPKNVSLYNTIEELKNSKSKANLIISDKVIEDDLASESVIYRPPSLVIGIGLHWDTSKETIKDGINDCLDKFKLSSKSIAKLVSIKKPEDVQGLIDVGKEMKIPVEYVEREDLAKVTAPNPSDTVKAFEGTPSVSEAAAILVSNGKLIVEKQKFPPNLTIAIARIEN